MKDLAEVAAQPLLSSMNPRTDTMPSVQIIGPDDGWILEKLARRLASKLPYAEFLPWWPQPSASTRLVYYVNYALYNEPSGLVDAGFFTHPDESHHFLERARAMDCCVCMARSVADSLKDAGIKSVYHIPMGCDVHRFSPRLVLGVVGRINHPRKGRHLLDQLRQLPFVEVAVTGGDVPEEKLGDFYQRLDYLLIPATVEGGPMSLLEALAAGKQVIAPAGVGLVPEFGKSENILLYPAGDAKALIALVRVCYQKKLVGHRLVADRTWDRWAEGHHLLFAQLLRDRGQELPEAAPGFRFGFLNELDVPPGIDVVSLEQKLDRIGAHLFYAQYAEARAELGELKVIYPVVEKLLRSIPS